MKKIGKYLLGINVIIGIIYSIYTIVLLVQYNCEKHLYLVMYSNLYLLINIILCLTALLCLRIYYKSSNIISIVISTIISAIIIWRYLG